MRACYKRFGPKLFDTMIAPISLEVRMRKAEAIETLMYGFVAWILNAVHYDNLKKADLEVLR